MASPSRRKPVELLGRVVLLDGQPALVRLEVLPERRDVAAGGAQVRERREELVDRLAEPDHEAGLGLHRRAGFAPEGVGARESSSDCS